MRTALFAAVLAVGCGDSRSAVDDGGAEGSEGSSVELAAENEDAEDTARAAIDVSGQKISELPLPDGLAPLALEPVSEVRRRQARRLNVEGLRRYERGDYAAAIASYSEALRADPGHLLARYNLSCAYNLAGEPLKGLALLAELRLAGCADCLSRLVRASEDADWNSMWQHPLFIEIVGVRVDGAPAEVPFWRRGADACPSGSRLRGAAPPDGVEIYCARGATRAGPYARWRQAEPPVLAEIGSFDAGARSDSWKIFYADGRLRETGPYRDGKRHGAWSEWHRSGTQAADGRYASGARHGRWTWFAEDGTIVKQGNFVRGQRVGPWLIEP